MSRAKKDSHNLNCNIERTLYDRLEVVCSVAGQTKTIAVERALAAYVEKMEDDFHIKPEEKTLLD